MKATAIVFAAALAFAGSAADRPNVLLICVDDLKPLLGCYGAPVIQSPNIDRLAARGTLFESAYCNQAVCAPSRNALMTGLRPTTLGIYDLGTNFRAAAPDAVTLAQAFARAGYRTEAMGKIMHVGHGNHEDAASWTVPHWRPPGGGPAGGYALEKNQADGPTREEARFANARGGIDTLPRGAATECADVPDSAYADGQIADEAVRRLQAAAAKPGEPFFLAVGFMKPHLPFVAPKKYWDVYDRAVFSPHRITRPPEGAPDFAPTTWGELRQYSDVPETGPLSPDLQRELIHGYHAATSYMDAQLGRVIAELDRTGLAGNTIIVLWGDHGWHLGDHGMWCKHTNYEQAARIPLLIVAPGVQTVGGGGPVIRPGGNIPAAGKDGVTLSGTRTRALAETVDLYPTLCELAGLPAPKGLDGTSLVPVLREPATPGREAVFHVYPRGARIGRAVRTARYRLVEWKKPGEPADGAILELYDYQADPDEIRNLAGSQPEVVARLRAILARQPEARPQVSGKAEAKKPAVGVGPGRASMFRKRDKNRDGKLTLEEFLDQPDPEAAKKRFPQFDTDRDGSLSESEFVGQGKP